MSWTRKQKRERDGKSQLEEAESFITLAKEPEDPRLSWLYDQINQLPAIERSLTLLLLDGYSYKEMASILGLSESNVGVKVNRIKKHLTNRSKEQGEMKNGI
jgi:RNA polymerase sigma-70 factor (ECF subfamily)